MSSNDPVMNRKKEIEQSSQKPVPLPPMWEQIPLELKEKKCWVVWDWRANSDAKGKHKWTKVPINPITGRYAKSNDPTTWGGFEDAKRFCQDNKMAGIGFVFGPDSTMTGIDFDNCINEHGELSEEVKTILERLDTYAEISPSGTGIKAWISGSVQPYLGTRPDGKTRWGTKKGNYEAYTSEHFFTVTGHRVGEKASINPDGQANLDWFLSTYLPHEDKKPLQRNEAQSTPIATYEESANSEAMQRSRSWPVIARLMNGDISGHNDDASAADLALASYCAFFFGPDYARVEAAFNKSKLADRPKWKDRPDYRQATIGKAISSCTEFYSERYQKVFVGSRKPEMPAQDLTAGCPPHNHEAERAVLSSMLQDNSIIPEVMRTLPCEQPETMFYDRNNALCFTAIVTVYKRTGRADAILLNEELSRLGQVHDDNLVQELLRPPISTNWPHYAEIVRQKAVQRNYRQAAISIQRETENPSDPTALDDNVQAIMLKAVQFSHRAEATKLTVECGQILDDADNPNPEPPGFTCRIPPLDTIFRAEPGTVTTIGAATSVGKSILLGQMAFGLASQGLPTLLISLEMRRKEIAQRTMSLAGEVRFNAIRGKSELTTAERKKLSEAYTTLSSIPLFVRSDHMSISAIETEARYAKMKHGLKVLAVDYLQLIDASRVSGESRTEVVGKISRGLKRIALELDVAVLTASQFNRETGETPTLANLRESGSIEQDSDAVILIWDDPDDQTRTRLYGRIAKQRNGDRADFTLARDANYMRFKSSL